MKRATFWFVITYLRQKNLSSASRFPFSLTRFPDSDFMMLQVQLHFSFQLKQKSPTHPLHTHLLRVRIHKTQSRSWQLSIFQKSNNPLSSEATWLQCFSKTLAKYTSRKQLPQSGKQWKCYWYFLAKVIRTSTDQSMIQSRRLFSRNAVAMPS